VRQRLPRREHRHRIRREQAAEGGGELVGGTPGGGHRQNRAGPGQRRESDRAHPLGKDEITARLVRLGDGRQNGIAEGEVDQGEQRHGGSARIRGDAGGAAVV